MQRPRIVLAMSAPPKELVDAAVQFGAAVNVAAARSTAWVHWWWWQPTTHLGERRPALVWSENPDDVRTAFNQVVEEPPSAAYW